MTDSPEPAADASSPVAGLAWRDDLSRRDNGVAPSGLSTGLVAAPLWLSLRLTARHLVALAVPAALLYVPTAIALSALIVIVVGRDGRIVNADLTVWTVSPQVAGVVVAAIVIGLAAEIMAIAAVTLMAAGLALNRRVRPRTALRAAARRAPTLAGLGLLAAVAGGAAAGAGALAAARTGHVWIGVATIAVLTFSVLWLAPALPIALVEGGGPVRALARAHASTRYRRRVSALVVWIGALAAPGLVIAGLGWAVSPLDGLAHTVLVQMVGGAAAVLVPPLQAMTLVVVALDQRYPSAVDLAAAAERMATDRVAAAERHPTGGQAVRRPPPSRLRAGAVLALLPLPGLLYAGYIWLNPLDLPRTSDHVLRDDFGRQPVALHLLRGDRPVELSGPVAGTIGLRVCGAASCHDGSRLYDYSGATIATKMGTVTLPDGTVAVAAWSPARGRETTRKRGEWVLRLFRCGTHGCGTTQSITTAPIIERGGGGDMYGFGVAATATAEGGLVLAAVEPSESNRDARLRIIRCADPRCATPAAVTATRLPMHLLGLFSRSLAVTVGGGDRPVVAFEDILTGGFTLVSCDTSQCRHPAINQSRRPPLPQPDGPDSYVDGIDVAVPPDDRPVAVYRDGRGGAATLLRCRTPDCRQLDTVALTAPGVPRPWPALALDRAGRPLVATYDLVRRRLVLVVCHDAGCTSRANVPIAPVEHGPGYLDLVVGRDGHPRVLWVDATTDLFGGGGPLHLTICQDPRCAG